MIVLYLVMLSGMIVAIIYDAYNVILGLLLIIAAIFFSAFNLSKKLRGNPNLEAYEKVVIDEEGRFFLDNMMFDIHEIKTISYTDKTMTLNFTDEIMIIDCYPELIDYFKSKEIVVQNSQDLKAKLFLIFQATLLVEFMIIVLLNIVGIITMMMYPIELIDTMGLIWDGLRIVFIILTFVFMYCIIKRKGALISGIAALVVLLSFLLPGSYHSFGKNYSTAYIETQNDNEKTVTLYKDVHSHYGSYVTQYKANGDYNIGEFGGVVCFTNGDKTLFTNLDDELTSKEVFLNSVSQMKYKETNGMSLTFKNNTAKVLGIEYQIEMVGNNVFALYIDNEYFYMGKRDDNGMIEIYSLKSMELLNRLSPASNYTNTENEEDKQSDQKQEDTKKEEENEQLNKEKQKQQELDEQNINAFNQAIKQKDISSFESNKQVVMIHSTSQNIYEVIRDLDREFTRVNNTLNNTITTQILSMEITGNENNLYAVNIFSRSDYSHAESESKNTKMAIKSYGDYYIATKVSNEMTLSDYGYIHTPDTRDTSQSYDYLYTVQGNKVTDNPW
ncbi:MAG: hypothetical protein RR585_03660 [Coprobacillus sp.]